MELASEQLRGVQCCIRRRPWALSEREHGLCAGRPTLSRDRPRRLARPRTSPFHGGNTGSNPVGDANYPTSFYSPLTGFRYTAKRRSAALFDHARTADTTGTKALAAVISSGSGPVRPVGASQASP